MKLDATVIVLAVLAAGVAWFVVSTRKAAVAPPPPVTQTVPDDGDISDQDWLEFGLGVVGAIWG